VPESGAHRLESAPRPDLSALELLRELSELFMGRRADFGRLRERLEGPTSEARR